VREYRVGDDLRRIHWRSTARVDELMVRREEQPHQSRATLVLDTRSTAHRGSGPASSFEYAVSAAASVASHLGGLGFTVRLLTDDVRATEATWHDRGVGGAAEMQLILDTLAVIAPSRRTNFSAASVDRSSSGLVVAVVGALTDADMAALGGLRAGATRGVAIVVDVAGWAQPGRTNGAAGKPAAEQAAELRHRGWSAVVAGPRDRLDSVWSDLTTRSDSARSATVDSTDVGGGKLAAGRAPIP
jgi:uncharacterized protein (DUF58 family)